MWQEFAGSGVMFVDGKAVGNVTSFSVNTGEDMVKEDRRFSKDIEGWEKRCHAKLAVSIAMLPADVWKLRAFGCCSKGGFTLPRGKMFRGQMFRNSNHK
ncbi:hypothetical protein ACRTDM_20330 [Shewanella algae]|uniref:hypothetical protein n=1 Tax=Shewanella algae TaxID=38313 RepID=UPI003D7F1440